MKVRFKFLDLGLILFQEKKTKEQFLLTCVTETGYIKLGTARNLTW